MVNFKFLHSVIVLIGCLVFLTSNSNDSILYANKNLTQFNLILPVAVAFTLSDMEFDVV